jgi:predicted metal-dependent hydrolase
MNDKSINIGSLAVPYKLVRSASVRKLKLSMTMDEFRITAPADATDEDIRDALAGKRRWIVENTATLRERYEKTHKVARFRTGAKIPYWGRLVKIFTTTVAVSSPMVRYHNGFYVDHPPYRTPAEHDDAVEASIQQYLRRRFNREALQWLRSFERVLGVSANQLRITNMSKRWGSCSRNGTVSLDWHLVYAPKRVARYVIAHELSHMHAMNHSDDFWRTVRRVYGDYQKEHRWLKENEHLLGYSRLDVRA